MSIHRMFGRSMLAVPLFAALVALPLATGRAHAQEEEWKVMLTDGETPRVGLAAVGDDSLTVTCHGITQTLSLASLVELRRSSGGHPFAGALVGGGVGFLASSFYSALNSYGGHPATGADGFDTRLVVGVSLSAGTLGAIVGSLIGSDEKYDLTGMTVPERRELILRLASE